MLGAKPGCFICCFTISLFTVREKWVLSSPSTALNLATKNSLFYEMEATTVPLEACEQELQTLTSYSSILEGMTS